uniref:Uncharacterized protein n=1 Tax=Arundo donax TaxID=35708 RepID=A0A0A9F9R9_ARUDO
MGKQHGSSRKLNQHSHSPNGSAPCTTQIGVHRS